MAQNLYTPQSTYKPTALVCLYELLLTPVCLRSGTTAVHNTAQNLSDIIHLIIQSALTKC